MLLQSTSNIIIQGKVKLPLGSKPKTMKTKSYISLIALLAGMAVSCAKIEQGNGRVEDRRICYDVIQDRSAVTKAAGVYPTGESFASYAWYLPDGKNWADDKEDAALYIDEAVISYDNARSSWYDQTRTYYWPKTGSLTFFSISPASVAESAVLTKDDGFWISSWDVAANQDKDIMVADIQTDKNANETVGSFTGVPTIFRHKLAMIEGFTFNTFKDYAPGKSGSSYKDDDKRFFIKSIKVNNLKQEGRFVSGNAPSSTNIGQWQVSGTSAETDYIWFSESEGVEVVYNSSESERIPANNLGGKASILVLPQTFTNPDDAYLEYEPNIEITYETWEYTNNSGAYNYYETTARASLYSILASVGNRLDMNKKITFNITINLNSNLIIWAPDQNDWTDDDFNISI